ncbi:MAG TPA: HlyD family secretion protein [Candidatus Tectomicrobia bacterium]|nr:HlyD family secretion protein [Candidatus Tectomicrobia bacterium]
MVDRLKGVLGNWRLLIPILFLAVGVVIGAKYGVEYWIYTMTHVYTDDARVKGTMVSLSPEVSGLVSKVHVDEGYEVKKGMVLVEIDQADYLTQLAQAEAACEAVQTQLLEAQRDLDLQIQRQGSELARAKALVDAKKSKLSEAETDLALERDKSKNSILEAEASYKAALSRLKEMEHGVKAADSDHDRAKRLFAEGIIATERRDQTQVAYDQAAARYTSAREGVEQAKARHASAIASEKMVELQSRRVTTLRAEVQETEAAYQLAVANAGIEDLKRERIKLLEAKLKEEEAKVAAARLRLENTVIHSPIDGVVSRKRVEQGEMVQRGQPILVVNDPQDVWVLSNVKETYIRDVHVGSLVDVWVDAYPSRIFRGTVESVGAAAISEFALFPPTGNFTKVEQRIPVRINVESADGLLKPGMMVIVGIEIPRGGKDGRENTIKATSSVN